MDFSNPFFVAAQIANLLNIIVTIAAFQFKKLPHILLGNVASNVLLALNYVFLGAFSGAWVGTLAAIQTIVIYFLDKKQTKKQTRLYLLVLFSVMYIIGTAIVYKQWFDCISCICALLYVASILQTNPKNLRRFSFVNMSLWIVYDICAGAYTTIITHVLVLSSIIIAMIRLDINRNKA